MHIFEKIGVTPSGKFAPILTNTPVKFVLLTNNLNNLKNLNIFFIFSGKEDAYRGPAIRALCAITDPAMLQAIERYMKQAIVDRSPAIASAALVSSLHIAKTGAGINI